jgi:hypothetical protein
MKPEKKKSTNYSPHLLLLSSEKVAISREKDTYHPIPDQH